MLLRFHFQAQINLSWETIFSTCKGSCKPTWRCDSSALGRRKNPSISEHLAYLEVSPVSLNPHSLISLSNISVQLEASCVSRPPRSKHTVSVFCDSSGVSMVHFAWLSFQFLSATPSCWDCYSWNSLIFLWGLTPLFWQQDHTLKINSVTAVITTSLLSLHRYFSLKYLSLNIRLRCIWVCWKQWI